MSIEFAIDDLSGPDIRALIARHLQGMHAHSEPGNVFALDVDQLGAADVTVWSAWISGRLAGCGALRQLDAENAELKSMRVADEFRGQGIGRALLEHLTAQARGRGVRQLWLETGIGPAFAPALRLYEAAGFARCGPFGSYRPNEFCVFMTRRI